jgi:hypothetical protein
VKVKTAALIFSRPRIVIAWGRVEMGRTEETSGWFASRRILAVSTGSHSMTDRSASTLGSARSMRSTTVAATAEGDESLRPSKMLCKTSCVTCAYLEDRGHPVREAHRHPMETT